METDVKLLRSIPPRLKGKIARTATRRSISFNDAVVEALARHYGVEYEPTVLAERTVEVGPYPNYLLRMPRAVKLEVERDAAARGESHSNRMKAILSDAWKVEHKPTGRWPSTRVATS